MERKKRKLKKDGERETLERKEEDIYIYIYMAKAPYRRRHRLVPTFLAKI